MRSEFGKIHNLWEKFNKFFSKVDKELAIDRVQEHLNFLKIHGF